jgi:hypothetical protein
MVIRRLAPFALLPALLLSGCGYLSAAPQTAVEYASDAEAATPHRTDAQLSMLYYGEQIEGAGGFDIDDDDWLLLQAENCTVARDLRGDDPASVSWYVPGVRPKAPYDDDMMLGATVAASLVTNCPTLLDPSWRWPELWGFIAAQGDGVRGGGGYRTMCEDGTWSSAGGVQGACSSHGGVAE